MTFHHESRFDRALHHLESLKTESRAWGKEHPYRMWTDFDVDPNYKLSWIEVLNPPPPELSLIIGECIHNLRSTLDNLAFELALAGNLGKPLPDKVAENSAFPIFSERKKFVKKRKSLIGCIPPRAQTIIQDLQPYNRGDGFWRDPLWHLYELSNMDKHRLPHVVHVTQLAQAFFVPENLTADDIEFIAGSIESRAPIARFPAIDTTGAEVDVQPAPSIGIAFGQQVPRYLRGMAVPMRLSYISDYILTRAVRPLQPYLFRRPVVQVSQRYCLLRDKSVSI
jgi:hypothetical protein